MRWFLAFVLVLSSLAVACSTNPMSGRDAGSVRSAGSPASSTETSTAGGQGGVTAGTGGSVGTAGAGTTAVPDGSAPSTDGCPSNSICFKNGRAQGLMSGWAWLTMGEPLTMDSPTCGTSHTPITSKNLCDPTDIAWSTSDSLCITGHIPALPPTAWCDPGPCEFPGFTIGVNAREPNGAAGAALVANETVTVTTTGVPNVGFKVFLHRKGDPDSLTYCYYSVASRRTMSLAKFNTKCWGDVTTVYFEPKDLPNIDQIGVVFDPSTQAFDLRDFCLTRISFE